MVDIIDSPSELYAHFSSHQHIPPYCVLPTGIFYNQNTTPVIMVNCGKGKANTVHPECIGEQHYSDDHGTGSAIKMAKAPDVDLEKGDGQAAPDPTVENALEKARDEGVPSKKGREMKPFKGKIEKMPFEGRNDNYPEGYTVRKVPIKGMSLNQTPKQTHQDRSGSAPEVPMHEGRAIPSGQKPRPPSKATQREKSAMYQPEQPDAGELALWQRAADVYNSMPGSKGNWTPEQFRMVYERMYRNPDYKADNPAYRDAVLSAMDTADWQTRQAQGIEASNQAVLDADARAKKQEAIQRSFVYGREHPEDPSTMLSVEQSERNKKQALREAGITDPSKVKRVQTPETTALSPVEAKNRANAGVEDKKRTLEPIGSDTPAPPISPSLMGHRDGQFVTDTFETDSAKFNGSHADASKALPLNVKVGPDTKGAERQATADKKLQTKTPPASEKDAKAVNEATGGLGTPNATKQSAKRLSAKGILTPEEFHARAAKGVQADVSRPTDRRDAYTAPKPTSDNALERREQEKAREESQKPVQRSVPKSVDRQKGDIIADKGEDDTMQDSARTDFPSFDELKKSGVKDLTVMWNDLLKSSDMEKAWAEERSWSDDEMLNDEIEEKMGAEHWSKEEALRRKGIPDTDGGAYFKLDAQYYPQTDTNYVNNAIERVQRADRANAIARSYGLDPGEDVVINGAIQKSFKQMMDEGSEKKIGTYGAPAGSNPYGYPLRGNGMPIQNGYQQVFISREDMVMPPIGQMKHTKN